MLYLRWLRWSGCSCVCRTLRVVVHMQFCKNKLPDLPIFCKTLGFKQFTNASSPSGYTYIYSRAQELCERQGGRPGLPSLIICMGYDRCGHKATPTKKQLSTELSMPWSTSDTGLNLLNAIHWYSIRVPSLHIHKVLPWRPSTLTTEFFTWLLLISEGLQETVTKKSLWWDRLYFPLHKNTAKTLQFAYNVRQSSTALLDVPAFRVF